MIIEIDSKRSDWMRIEANGATEAEALAIAQDAVASVVDTLGVPRHRIVASVNVSGDDPVIEVRLHPFRANLMGRPADRLLADLRTKGRQVSLREQNPRSRAEFTPRVYPRGIRLRPVSFNPDSLRD